MSHQHKIWWQFRYWILGNVLIFTQGEYMNEIIHDKANKIKWDLIDKCTISQLLIKKRYVSCREKET